MTPGGPTRSPERLVVGFSGGKDSLATALLCHELAPTTLLHADTGWDHPGHSDYLRATAEALGLPLVIVGRPGGMIELVRHKRMFPSRTRRFCTSELKIVPIGAYLRDLDEDVLNVVGVRAEESAARAKLPEWQYFDEGDCWSWRPLLRWTLDDVLEVVRRSGIPLHPHYSEGATRVGCWPCIYARKSEISALPQSRIAEIADLESEIEAMAKDGGGRSFFQCRDPLNIETGTGFVPIERVHEWARTSRGGRAMLLDLPRVSWGLCERPSVEGGEG